MICNVCYIYNAYDILITKKKILSLLVIHRDGLKTQIVTKPGTCNFLSSLSCTIKKLKIIIYLNLHSYNIPHAQYLYQP